MILKKLTSLFFQSFSLTIPKSTKNISILFLLISSFLLHGCMTSRSTLYLQHERSGVYLAKEHRPSKKEEDALAETGVMEARKMLKAVPESNRILGGYCTKPSIKKMLKEMQEMAPTCYAEVKIHQNRRNLNSVISWSLLGGIAGSGMVMVLGGLFASDGETKTNIALVFGIPMVAAALTHELIPFSKWEKVSYRRATFIDNYLWTMRARIQNEVCNAKDFTTAEQRAYNLKSDLKKNCSPIKDDNGLYKE